MSEARQLLFGELSDVGIRKAHGDARGEGRDVVVALCFRLLDVLHLSVDPGADYQVELEDLVRALLLVGVRWLDDD